MGTIAEPPNRKRAPTEVRFSSLRPALSKPIIEALTEAGFEFCTQTQLNAIPLFCSFVNRDVAVEAAPGSGKTLSFLVPLVEFLHRASLRPKPHQVMGMIISPTRELSSQIHSAAQPLIATLPGFRSVLLGGETDVERIEEEGANLLIGTPRRLLEIMDQVQVLDFSRFEVLILDDADMLLDMGFQNYLNSIICRLPKQRRSGLFSTTLTKAVQELAEAGLRNHMRIKIMPELVLSDRALPSKSSSRVFRSLSDRVSHLSIY